MRNFHSESETVVVQAPYAVTAGQGLRRGLIFGVAVSDAAINTDVVVNLLGAYDLTKIGSQAWTVGALVYWDDANRRCTTVATGAILIGVALAAVGAGAGETIGRVRLNAAFRPQEV
jgi:predicted RecA/RadA family phage recombinase